MLIKERTMSSNYNFIYYIGTISLLPKLTSLDLLVGSFIGSFVLLSIPLVLMSALNPILISIIKDKNDQSSVSKSGFVLFGIYSSCVVLFVWCF